MLGVQRVAGADSPKLERWSPMTSTTVRVGKRLLVQSVSPLVNNRGASHNGSSRLCSNSASSCNKTGFLLSAASSCNDPQLFFLLLDFCLNLAVGKQ